MSSNGTIKTPRRQPKEKGFWTVLYDDYWQGWLFVADKEEKA